MLKMTLELDNQIYAIRNQLRLLKKDEMQKQVFLHAGEHDAMKWIYKLTQERGQKPRMLDVCEILNIAQATLTSLIDRLIKKGYVTREVSEKDKRIKLLALTAEGESILLTLQQEQHRRMERIVNHLGKEDTAQLVRLLSKINEALIAEN